MRDFEDTIGSEKSPGMGELGGEKVCNKANLQRMYTQQLIKGDLDE